MKFYRDDIYAEDYCERRRRKLRSFKQVISEMEEAIVDGWTGNNRYLYFSVSTWLRGFLWWEKYFMAIDCDSEEDMLAAGNHLATDNIGYCIVESSPGHFWLFTDFIGAQAQIRNRLKKVLGCDKNYRLMRKSYIRAFPKFVEGRVILPRFVDYHTLKNQLVKQWVESFIEYFNSNAIKKVIKSYQLAHALRSNTMHKMAANPTFKI